MTSHDDLLAVCERLDYVALAAMLSVSPQLAHTRFDNGDTSLHYAAFGGALPIILLLRNGADINAKDRSGRTALHQVFIGRSDFRDEVVYLLAELGLK